jgi:hypothetical protein
MFFFLCILRTWWNWNFIWSTIPYTCFVMLRRRERRDLFPMFSAWGWLVCMILFHAVAGEVGLLQSFGGVTTCYAFLHGQPHTCIVFPVTACMLPHMVHDHNMIHCWNCQRRWWYAQLIIQIKSTQDPPRAHILTHTLSQCVKTWGNSSLHIRQRDDYSVCHLLLSMPLVWTS